MARAYPGSFTCMNTIVHAEVERGLVSKVPGGACEKSFPGCCAARSDAQLIRGPTLCARWDPGYVRSSAKNAAPRPGHEKIRCGSLSHCADHLRNLLDN